MSEWRRDIAWRQGHLLGDDARAVLNLRHHSSPEQTIAIVATHDCDLAQDPSRETVVEVVVGRMLAKSGDSTHAKNARRLHIEFEGQPNFWCEFEAAQKVPVDKLTLSKFAPRDATLTLDSLVIFQMWLASRYRRSAFPDEFECRLKETKLAEKIAKAVKPHAELVTGIFFDVDEGKEITRNGPDDTYTLDILILYSGELDFDLADKAAAAAAADIQKAFEDKLFKPANTWKNIELRSCEPVSEAVLTYQQFKQLKRWRLDHLSLAADPQQPVLPE